MTLHTLLAWTAVLSSLVVLVQARSARIPSAAWTWASIAVLTGTLVALALLPEVGGYVGGALWAVVLLVPSLLSRAAQAAAARTRYGRAAQLIGAATLFHPSSALRLVRSQLVALDLAQRGDEQGALAALVPLEQAPWPIGVAARAERMRIERQYGDLVLLVRTEQAAGRELPASLAALQLRALGECGLRSELPSAFEAERMRLAQPGAQGFLDAARLYLFAFCGELPGLERLLLLRMAQLPSQYAAFWRATALFSAGRGDEAHALLAAGRATGDPALRAAIAVREATALSVEPSAAERALCEREHAALEADVAHALAPAPVRRAPATLLLLATLAAGAFVQLQHGAYDDVARTFELGALWPPSVLEQTEWSRVLTFQVLHASVLHLTMNALALLSLGRVVEPKLGALRTLVVYTAAGCAAGLLCVGLVAAGWRAPQLLVGASGGVMGLVGALLALAGRAVLHHDTPSSRRTLALAALAVGVQWVFDLVTPMVSGVAHASGLVTGFALTTLAAPARPPAALVSATPPRGPAH